MLMKMDYNNFVRLVDEVLGDREDLNTYAIEVGFDLLTAYLRRFAEIAIERNDAMGFPHDYIIDRDVRGNAINRGDQVARCGNAVCPAVAEALTRANLPECCMIVTVADMAHLHELMTS